MANTSIKGARGWIYDKVTGDPIRRMTEEEAKDYVKKSSTETAKALSSGLASRYDTSNEMADDNVMSPVTSSFDIASKSHPLLKSFFKVDNKPGEVVGEYVAEKTSSPKAGLIADILTPTTSMLISGGASKAAKIAKTLEKMNPAKLEKLAKLSEAEKAAKILGTEERVASVEKTGSAAKKSTAAEQKLKKDLINADTASSEDIDKAIRSETKAPLTSTVGEAMDKTSKKKGKGVDLEAMDQTPKSEAEKASNLFNETPDRRASAGTATTKQKALDAEKAKLEAESTAAKVAKQKAFDEELKTSKLKLAESKQTQQSQIDKLKQEANDLEFKKEQEARKARKEEAIASASEDWQPTPYDSGTKTEAEKAKNLEEPSVEKKVSKVANEVSEEGKKTPGVVGKVVNAVKKYPKTALAAGTTAAGIGLSMKDRYDKAYDRVPTKTGANTTGTSTKSGTGTGTEPTQTQTEQTQPSETDLNPIGPSSDEERQKKIAERVFTNEDISAADSDSSASKAAQASLDKLNAEADAADAEFEGKKTHGGFWRGLAKAFSAKDASDWLDYVQNPEGYDKREFARMKAARAAGNLKTAQEAESHLRASRDFRLNVKKFNSDVINGIDDDNMKKEVLKFNKSNPTMVGAAMMGSREGNGTINWPKMIELLRQMNTAVYGAKAEADVTKVGGMINAAKNSGLIKND